MSRARSTAESDRAERAARGLGRASALVVLICLAFVAWPTIAAGRPVPSAPLDRQPIRIDPANAGVGEWSLLPGIGPALARRIVAERASRGGFRSVEDLLAVPGIGPARLEALRPSFARVDERHADRPRADRAAPVTSRPGAATRP